jgi:hypothetical protein
MAQTLSTIKGKSRKNSVQSALDGRSTPHSEDSLCRPIPRRSQFLSLVPWLSRVAFVQKRLQDQRGRHLIYNSAVFLAGMAGFIQNFVGFATGEPLIPHMDGQAGQLAQLGGEGLGSGSLRAQLAGQVQRIPNDDAGHGIPPSQPCQRAQVVPGCAAAAALPLQRQHWLGRQAQFVGHGHPDAAVAHVEREKAGMRVGFQILAPVLILASSLMLPGEPAE